MAPAASVTFFKPELQDFLYAPISERSDEMSFSVLSAFARLGIDPWAEAAELTELSVDAANERLTALIARLPGTWSTTPEAKARVGRLVRLLPRHGRTEQPVLEKSRGLGTAIGAAHVSWLICAALALALMVFIAVANHSASTQRDGGEGRPAETRGQRD